MKKRYAKATWTRASEQPGKRGAVSITYIQTIIVGSIKLQDKPNDPADIAAVWANKPKGDGWTLTGIQLPPKPRNAQAIEAAAEARIQQTYSPKSLTQGTLL